MLDLRSHLCLGLLDLALSFVQGTALIELLVGAAACCDLPDHFAASMFGALFDAGVAGIRADDVLVTIPRKPDFLIADAVDAILVAVIGQQMELHLIS